MGVQIRNDFSLFSLHSIFPLLHKERCLRDPSRTMEFVLIGRWTLAVSVWSERSHRRSTPSNCCRKQRVPAGNETAVSTVAAWRCSHCGQDKAERERGVRKIANERSRTSVALLTHRLLLPLPLFTVAFVLYLCVLSAGLGNERRGISIDGAERERDWRRNV
jgi:hypothetical protein